VVKVVVDAGLVVDVDVAGASVVAGEVVVVVALTVVEGSAMVVDTSFVDVRTAVVAAILGARSSPQATSAAAAVTRAARWRSGRERLMGGRRRTDVVGQYAGSDTRSRSTLRGIRRCPRPPAAVA
tara:strand:- start:429 stop:803 length:375 start_codon:yes stop_codon:yes gene_type:complete